MTIKKYQGNSKEEAIALAKKELGQNIEKNIIAIENNTKRIRENNNVKKRTTRMDKLNTQSK